jgi:phosphate acetyltransferase
MKIIKNLESIAKKNKKRIVLPEASDRRILQAAEYVLENGLCDIILIGNETNIKNSGINISSSIIFDPDKDKEQANTLIDAFVELRKDKKMTLDEARVLFSKNYTYYGCMMVKEGLADGVVSGAIHSSSDTLRPALQIIKNKSDIPFVSSFFLIDMKEKKFGEDGVFIYSDCGLVQYPNEEELAVIATVSNDSFKSLIGKTPKVAMLSHSTKGSAKGESITKVCKATEIVRKNRSDIIIDGELQFDAAIIPEIRKTKAPNSILEGSANVLIFPDLDSGNIAYKITERLAHAHAYGPITQGLNKPINDLSRGSTVEDIIGVIIITVVQAINN